MLNPIKRLALSGYLTLDKVDFGLFLKYKHTYLLT